MNDSTQMLVGLVIIAIVMSTFALIVGIAVLRKLGDMTQELNQFGRTLIKAVHERAENPFKGYARPMDEPAYQIDRTTRP